ncbi:hypothetical protein [Microbacterium telephonicum]|uniref:Uncharacterized protein n=1 Tax=Microbacterium telephonicum TaxID=1714841 RepID=A0A498CBB5_9MICO|nr:hypothetical protein [Microbacterium telephonicum]RLK52439.1 hypothetical protein C7474_0377 [Microbacterium telephonicum]
MSRPQRRRKRRSRRPAGSRPLGEPVAGTGASGSGAPEPLTPEWAGIARGGIRWIVLGCALVAVLAMSLLDPNRFLLIEPGFWVILLLGAGGAAVASALRLSAFPAEALVHPGGAARWKAALGVILTRVLGDVLWAVIALAVGMVLRATVAGFASGWASEAIRSILVTPAMAFMAFAGVWIAAALVVLAVTVTLRWRRMRAAGEAVPAAAWWAVGVTAGAALFLIGLLGVGLSDTSSVSMDGGEAFLRFLFGAVPLPAWWQVALLWLARLGAAVLGFCLIGLVVTRIRGRARP